MMPIIVATEKIKAYEGLQMLCEYAGQQDAWREALWQELLEDGELYAEFVYYLENHGFADRMKVEKYSLSDIYVWQMECFNLAWDSGKNTENCNKEKMVLQAFKTMADMKKAPDYYRKKLGEGVGMDKL